MVIALLIIGFSFNVFVGFLVSLRRRDRAARMLAIVAFAMACWLLSNYLADQPSSLALWWNRLAFVLPMMVLLFGNQFLIALKNKKSSGIESVVVVATTLAVAVISLTPLIVSGVVPRVDRGIEVGLNPVYGTLYPLYIAWIILLIVLYVRQLVIDNSRLSSQQHEQMRLVRFGSVIAVVLGVTTNLILPNILKSSSSTQLFPLTTLFFMGTFSIAILKHKLFDIRAFMLRTTAYSLTVLILAISYIAPLIFLFLLIFKLPFHLWQFLLATLVGVIAATYYHRLHQWFNKVTNKYFFRDAYDPTELFNELNKSLVSVLTLQNLLSKTETLIRKYIKSEFCIFLLPKSETMAERVLGGGKDVLKDLSFDQIRIGLGSVHTHESVVRVEDIITSSPDLAKTMLTKDIALIIKLMPSGMKGDITNGYILVGQRKSGKQYDSTDIQIFETMTSTLDIAMQNVLHYEEIQRFNETLQQKVEEATRKLRANNEKLKKMDEAKDEFISMASHQLRTPLTSVKGYVSMVLDGDAGPISDQQRQLLKQSFLSSERMANLISDLLNLSRINTGKFVMELVPVDLRQVIAAELEQLRETAEAKGLTVVYDPPETFPTLSLDENKMHQVVMNLVDNAIFYTHEGGTITLKLIETPTAVEFRVVDTGIGVPRDDQRHLFSKMFRAENARRARPDGTGLGLFMVKKVVVAQGGAILFDSIEGKGSTFGFHFSRH